MAQSVDRLLSPFMKISSITVASSQGSACYSSLVDVVEQAFLIVLQWDITRFSWPYLYYIHCIEASRQMLWLRFQSTSLRPLVITAPMGHGTQSQYHMEIQARTWISIRVWVPSTNPSFWPIQSVQTFALSSLVGQEGFSTQIFHKPWTLPRSNGLLMTQTGPWGHCVSEGDPTLLWINWF